MYACMYMTWSVIFKRGHRHNCKYPFQYANALSHTAFHANVFHRIFSNAIYMTAVAPASIMFWLEGGELQHGSQSLWILPTVRIREIRNAEHSLRQNLIVLLRIIWKLPFQHLIRWELFSHTFFFFTILPMTGERSWSSRKIARIL